MFRSRQGLVLAVSLVVAVMVRDVTSECKITDDVCEFWLEVENSMTMFSSRDAVYAQKGKLYKYDVEDPDTATPIDPSHVVVTDGWETPRLVVVVNGTMPGPPIEVYENQQVIIRVHNKMRSDGVTIHWHGLHQPGTPWMDGVAFVTQCPIGPGSTFTYRFKATPRGTYFYHSHIGAQLGMGLVGAFIIHEKKAKQMEEHIMVLQDWNHDWDADISHYRMELGSFKDRQRMNTTDSLEGGHFSNFLFQSGLINGKGRFFDEKDDPVHQTPLEVYKVTKDKKYRFRVIGAGNLYPFRVSIDNHLMKIVASDGYDIQPFEAESFVINPGERFDFVIEANQAVGNHWIRAETLEVKVVNHVGLAILRYEGAKDEDPTGLKARNFRKCTAEKKCVVLNCPYLYYPAEQNTVCEIFSEMKALYLDEAPGEDGKEEVEDIFLNFAFPGTKKTPGSTNGVQFLAPPAPPLTQPQAFETACRPEHGCGEQKICACGLSIDLKYGKIYQFVMMNLGKGKGWAHPMHMHGHSFHVVKMGYPSYDKTTGKVMEDNPDIDCRGNTSAAESFCNKATWTNSSWAGNNVPGLKLTWSPRKDTIIVPTGGYAVVRIKADNPGVWFMHCHIEMHNLDGMALVLNESFERHPPPPPGFPKCGNFDYDPANHSGQSDAQMDDEEPISDSVLTEKVDASKEVSIDSKYDEDCVDTKIFWIAVACLIALALLQFIVIVFLCRRSHVGKSKELETPESGNAYHNEGFAK